MYFGVDYHPEQWVFPYGGTAENPEAAWERDVVLMVKAGINVVRIGEFSWGLCEPEDGKFDFNWLHRVMDILGKAGIEIVLGTPTAAPPIWLTKKHPEILPLDEQGRVKHEGTRRAVCLNSDEFWNYSKRIVEHMAKALGKHPQLIAWQIDNSLGGNFTEASFNDDTRLDWHGWLEAKYENVPRMNKRMGLRHWGQTVTHWNQMPMPMHAPAAHNPALVLDWCRFCSDTIVQFVKMQADVLHELTPNCPVTTNLRPLIHRFDHFDLAEVLDFVSIESTASIKAKSSELSCEIDMLRSLKKTGIRTPDGDSGFWVMEQKAGNVNWQDVNSLVRPGVLRMFTYQLVSRGATAILFFAGVSPGSARRNFTAPSCHITSKVPAGSIRRSARSAQNLNCSRPRSRTPRSFPKPASFTATTMTGYCSSPTSPTNFSACANTSSSSITRCMIATFRWISPVLQKICRNTKSSSRHRSTCWPPAKPTV